MRREITDFLYIDQRKNHTYYLKFEVDGEYIRKPLQEYHGYQLLSSFIRMPKAKIAQTVRGPVLVVEGLDAPSADKLLVSSPLKVKEALNLFLFDILKMWEFTATTLIEKQLVRNWRAETLSTLNTIAHNNEFQAIENMPLKINGEIYPSLKTTLGHCYQRLQSKNENTMMLCHGDEHLGNVLVGNDGYWTIDPGNHTGYNTVSSTINNLLGGIFIFNFQYSGTFSFEDELLQIDYSLNDTFKPAEILLSPVLKSFIDNSRHVSGNNLLIEELFFINQLRIAFGLTHRRMDLTNLLKNRMLFIALSCENYYSHKFS